MRRRVPRLFFGILVSLTAISSVHASSDAERNWQFTPGIEVHRTTLKFDEEGPGSGQELASGLSLAARLTTGTNLAKTFSVGLDLRQSFARADGQSDFGILATRLGVRGDWLVFENWHFGAAWYFGDTIVVRHHDRQYNGTSAAFSLSTQGGGSAVWFVQYSFGSYREGPGFITLSRRPGDESLHQQSVGFGVEFPIGLESLQI